MSLSPPHVERKSGPQLSGFVLFIASGILALALGLATLALARMQTLRQNAESATASAQSALYWQSAQAAVLALAQLDGEAVASPTEPAQTPRPTPTPEVQGEPKEEETPERILPLTAEATVQVLLLLAPAGVDPRSVERERLITVLKGLELSAFDAIGAADALTQARRIAPPQTLSGWLEALELDRSALADDGAELGRVLQNLEQMFAIGVSDPAARYLLAQASVTSPDGRQSRLFLVQILADQPLIVLEQRATDTPNTGLPDMNQQG